MALAGARRCRAGARGHDPHRGTPGDPGRRPRAATLPPAAVRGLAPALAAPATAAGVAAAVLLAFAIANAMLRRSLRARSRRRAGYLYGRAAQFADCDRFTPPPGTEVLCEDTPASDRPGAYFYLFDPAAPAARAYGGFGESDELVGEWAKRAIRAQPGDYLSTTWEYLRAYWFSGLTPAGGHQSRPTARLHGREPVRGRDRTEPGVVLQPVHGRSGSARARVPPRLAGGVPIRRHRACGDDRAHADRAAASATRRSRVGVLLVRDRRPGAAGGTGPDRQLRRSLHGADGRSAGRRLGDCAGRALASPERTPRARGPTAAARIPRPRRPLRPDRARRPGRPALPRPPNRRRRRAPRT